MCTELVVENTAGNFCHTLNTLREYSTFWSGSKLQTRYYTYIGVYIHMYTCIPRWEYEGRAYKRVWVGDAHPWCNSFSARPCSQAGLTSDERRFFHNSAILKMFVLAKKYILTHNKCQRKKCALSFVPCTDGWCEVLSKRWWAKNTKTKFPSFIHFS